MNPKTLTKPKGGMEFDALQAEVRKRLAEENAEREMMHMGFTSLASLPKYVPDEENPAVLFKGRWLERGGSAWVVSTSGTGKSIFAMQMMLAVTVGKPFAGLHPNGPLRCWYVQSEDSDTRLGIDRDDVLAELEGQYPDVPRERWNDALGQVRIMPIGGTGATFLSDLAMKLKTARRLGVLPDVLVINPFLAVVGGPITDGAYVTPFLRGGTINHEKTDGLQRILEYFGVGALIFHHTPKPPTEKEVQGWLKSAFPEYQGAGSSDITNWGRSFITMMRVPGKPNVVCLTAGKNGADIGWDNIDGAFRRYIAWSKSHGVTGRTRHAWRELDDEEMAEIVKDADNHLAEDVNALVEDLKRTPQRRKDVLVHRCGMSHNRFRSAWAMVVANCTTYGIAAWAVKVGMNEHVFYGESAAAKAKAVEAFSNWKSATGYDGVMECHEVTNTPVTSQGVSRGDGVMPPLRGGISPCHLVPRNQGGVTPQAEDVPESLIDQLEI